MLAPGEKGDIIKYVPFVSFVQPSFWHALTEMKLEVDRLNETTKQIYGRFTNRTDVGTVFEVEGASFNETPDPEQYYLNIKGTIMNKNTIEEFKNIDKAALINSVGEMIWASVKDKTWIKSPEALLNFFVLSFADLKKFHYYYWFAFPSPSQPTVYMIASNSIVETFSNKEINELNQAFKTLDTSLKCFFVVTKDSNSLALKSLTQFISENEQNFDATTTYFAFSDPSKTSNPGWPLRMYLAALLDHYPALSGTYIQILGMRLDKIGGIEGSTVFQIRFPQTVQTTESAGWVGWERNDKGNFGPRLANMSASMDPLKLADASSDLNIKLMKWRLVPDLDVEVMKTTKCLLLGAGTLGCHVARDLLAWGFRRITFLDNGKVSYSNPTRQVLFTHNDCVAGGRNKAEAAADNLRNILPTVITKGLVSHIPMPGHPVGDSLKEETIANIRTITDAIAENDVVFLLLDTREARWLPTLIAAHYGKIVINAALGFDSYMVIRHGLGISSDDSSSCQTGSNSQSGSTCQSDSNSQTESIRGGRLGCYFCNDVTAPGNSLKDRTLDQQCTVTRPGVACVAGALAVELLMGLLQHPLRADAPALYNFDSDSKIPAEMQGVLGAIPHSIRGFLHSYQSVTPTCPKFNSCIACSDVVIRKYREEGTEFLLKVFNSGTYLEEVTGLQELHLTAELTDILTLSDEDED